MLLLFLVFFPFICGLLCWQSANVHTYAPRWIALFSMGILFIISIFLCKIGNYTSADFNVVTDLLPRWQLEYVCSWIPRFGINIHLALDGFSLLMLVLSAFLGCMAVLCSWNEIQHYQGYFYLNLLWILGGSIGVFLSVDMFLFFFFWEIMLAPMYFLISLWGHSGSSRKVRVRVATKFFIYAQLSGLFLLISIISLVSINYYFHGFWSFSYRDFLHMNFPSNMEYFLLLGFFLAFAIKMPIFPFHAWLPDTHVQSPTAGSVDLSGILIKTAAYGFFRFVLPFFPYASRSFAPIAMILGILNIFYGACMAFMQTDMKRLIAYASISHTGFILIAIFSGSLLSYQGAVIQMITHSLSVSGMFILCGQLYERLHTRDIRLMGGLWNRINLIPAFSLCFSVAMLGLPGTGNFIGEVIILFGTFQVFPVLTIIAVFGIVFISVYSLMLIQRVYYGSNLFLFKNNRFLKNMTLREKFIVVPLLVCIFLFGFFPQLILDFSSVTMKNIFFNHIHIYDINK